jgi:hypothetical protein
LTDKGNHQCQDDIIDNPDRIGKKPGPQPHQGNGTQGDMQPVVEEFPEKDFKGMHGQSHSHIHPSFQDKISHLTRYVKDK